ncbi:hypothetical protein BDC45DRAFT_493564, partial [Circinella umbellata]
MKENNNNSNNNNTILLFLFSIHVPYSRFKFQIPSTETIIIKIVKLPHFHQLRMIIL